MKNSLHGLKSRLDTANKRISNKKYLLKHKKRGKWKKTEHSIEDLWDNIKWYNKCVFGGQKKKRYGVMQKKYHKI